METVILFLSFFAFSLFLPFSANAKTAPQVTRYYNGKVIRDHALHEEDLWVSNGKIVAPQRKADHEIDVHGAFIAPGYIDLQINGAFGHDFTSEPESVAHVASLLPQYGVTAFLPTVVSSLPDAYRTLLPKMQKAGAPSSAEILGLHLEGPYFCPEKRGAHDPAALATFSETPSPETLYGSLSGVKLITLAPELPGALAAIHALKEQGIAVSAGHTNATYEETVAGIDAGITLATHLFNAMRPFHHREPGILGAVLTHPIYYSIIADEQHVHPAVITLAWKANPEGLILVTDAIAALGLPDGTYRLGLQEISLEQGKATLSGTETLAGGAVGLDQAVRNLYRIIGCTVVEAVEAATIRPARLLGLEGVKGSLNIGADADFLLLDQDLNILKCYIKGKDIH